MVAVLAIQRFKLHRANTVLPLATLKREETVWFLRYLDVKYADEAKPHLLLRATEGAGS